MDRSPRQVAPSESVAPESVAPDGGLLAEPGPRLGAATEVASGSAAPVSAAPVSAAPVSAAPVSAAPVSAAPVGSRSLEAVSAAWSRLAAVPSGGLEGQRERIEAIRALEDLKDAASAAQAELAVALVAAEVDAAGSACDAAARDDDGRAEVDRDDSQDGEPTRQLEASSRLRERKVAQARRSAIGQIALARRESPHRARTLVGVAEALV